MRSETKEAVPWNSGVRFVVFCCLVASCSSEPGRQIANEKTEPVDSGRFALLARIAHISDTQIIDEESPARLAFTNRFVDPAWRPQEAYSTQLFDGIIRAVNRYHATGTTIDFLVHTGDAVDNSQLNELDWYLTVMDGGRIDPRSGPDDRPEGERPTPELDPHHSFTAEGLYRNGVHGDGGSIPWYTVLGNHDHLSLGVFTIVANDDGELIGRTPLTNPITLLLPVELNPVGDIAWGPITPADLTPPTQVPSPSKIEANVSRRFVTPGEYRAAHFDTVSAPAGHGLGDAGENPLWSASPVPGLRLIGVNSSNPPAVEPGGLYSEGAVDLVQFVLLGWEIDAACDAGERVVVLTHHPSDDFDTNLGDVVSPAGWRDLLNRHSCVDLHLAGHSHQSRVWDRGDYLEIETGSILDFPQEGRFIEVWRDDESGETELRYWMFSHLDEYGAPINCGDTQISEDPLRGLRKIAYELALED